MPDTERAAGPGRTYVVDAHHHLWDPSALRHAWLDNAELAPLRRRFDLADYRSAAARGVGGLPVGSTVLVQALASEAETRTLLEVAAKDALVGAVVGWVDLDAADVSEQLAGLRSAPGGERLRGIRHLVQDESDPDWLLRPRVLSNLRRVQEAGLAFDVLVRPQQLRSAAALAEKLPGLPLVLDHAGKPDLTGDPTSRPDKLSSWASRLHSLATHQQVTCKLSGLVTEADWTGWSLADLVPAFDVLLDAFGPSRMMFGSDWPVCELAAPWGRWAETVGDLIDALTPGEQADILGSAATALSLAVGVAACSSGGSSASGSGGASASGGGKSFTYWSMWKQGEPGQKVLAAAIKDFEKKTGDTVNVQWVGRQNMQKLTPALNTGNVPDLVDGPVSKANPTLVATSQALGLKAAWADKTADGGTVSSVIPAKYLKSIDINLPDGQPYMVPYNIQTDGVWFNAAKYPELKTNPPKTWAQFTALLAKFKSQGVAPIAADGNVPGYNAYWLELLMMRAGGPGILKKTASDKTGQAWKNPIVLKAAEQVAQMVKNGDIIKGYSASQFPYQEQQWANTRPV
ncbi:extracellular solute-binding protein [Leekyejoonella antrihumi]|uniref:extracellular solute-binding protein n=1 Tax=Leekyejoonella antrihumi TaxID=1660198 RepID=UPI001C957C83|nr:amidohydrolase family protein [Leekyejoonella antrihumi]